MPKGINIIGFVLGCKLEKYLGVGMNTVDKVCVYSRSFSKNEKLKEKLLSRYRHVQFNDWAST